MNLVTDKWIPVVNMEGKPDDASLMQIFTEGDKIADLAVRPHERVALMRLFICIASAALDGPENKDEWEQVPKKLPSAAKKYLNEWQSSFNLFDEKKPFLQIDGLKQKKGTTKRDQDLDEKKLTPVSKLDITLATGNNSTLFSHQTKPILSEKQTALNLLAYQNFTASGTIGIAEWNGKESPGMGASFPAPCIDKSMLHTFLRRGDMLQTIALNVLSKKQVARFYGNDKWGNPVWEMFPNNFFDKDRILNATHTYLGRLVPITRVIRIRCETQDMIMANGFKYPLSKDGLYEATATTKIRNNTRELLKVTGNEIWRELSSIIVRNIADNNGARGPKALENIHAKTFDVWCGGIKWTTKGGYVESMESIYSISTKMLTADGHSLYESSIEVAEMLSKKLGWAVEEYRKNIDGFWETRSDRKRNENAYIDKGILHSKATRNYWTAVEKHRHLLMDCVDALGTDRIEKADETWRKALHKAARESYIASCGQDTSRQIRAFALGLRELFSKKEERQNETGGEE